MAAESDRSLESRDGQRKRGRSTVLWSALDRLATLVVLGLGITVLWNQLQPNAGPGQPRPFVAPDEPISFNRSPTAGVSEAQVVMVVYSDFQCPFCARFARTTWPQLRASHVDNGRVFVAFKNYPLTRHSKAIPSAAAAECAAEQQQFWPMHDRLFAEPTRLDEDTIVAHAKELKLNLAEWLACRAGAGMAKVQRDLEEATRFGLPSTPLFFIGRRIDQNSMTIDTTITGAKSAQEFREVFDRLLRDAVH